MSNIFGVIETTEPPVVYNDNHIVYRSTEGEDDIAVINSLQRNFTGGNGGTIQLPSPEYTGASTLDLNQGVHLVGCGSGHITRGFGTRIVSSEPTVVFMTGRHSSISKLNLRSTAATDAVVVHIRGGREMLLEDVWITDAGANGTGVFIEGGRGYGSYINKLVRVHASGLETGIHVYGTITNGARRANHNALWGCRTDSCDVGVMGEESDTLQLFSHHAESCRDAGLKLVGSSIRTGVSQSYFENARSGNADVDATGASTGGLGWVKLIASRHGALIDPLNKIEII